MKPTVTDLINYLQQIDGDCQVVLTEEQVEPGSVVIQRFFEEWDENE